MSAQELGDAELVVTELLSNSVRHAAIAAGDPLHVRASTGLGVLHVEVEDAGRAAAIGVRPAGIGLNVVDTLATVWGVRRGQGTVVWAEMPCRQAA